MLSKEINTIPEFKEVETGYLIYENGQIWSNLSNKFLTPTKKYTNSIIKQKWEKGELEREPYFLYRVTLKTKQGTYRKFLVHRIVACAFIPNPNNLLEVNHKDADTSNNSINNLEWITSYDNKKLIYNIKSKKVWRCDINTHQRIESYPSARAAERAGYGNNGNISQVCNGKRQSSAGYFWEYEDC